MTETDLISALYQAVQTRPRPEDAAELVRRALADSLTPIQSALIDRAARRSLRRYLDTYTSMAQDFFRPVSKVDRQVRVATALFNITGPILSAEDSLDAEKVLEFLRPLAASIHTSVDGKTTLNSKAERRAAGIYKNARWYNKRVRLFRAIHTKLEALAWSQRRYAARRIQKSGLGYQVTREDLAADGTLNTAAFVAYASARMSLRSTFTNEKQVRWYDDIAEMLLDRCDASPTTRWDVIALLVPDDRIISRLSDEIKGQLVGRWWNALTDLAEMLEKAWVSLQDPQPSTGRALHGAVVRALRKPRPVNKLDMIVQTGVDSSTWNETAGAWTKAREHWITLLYSLGLDGLLDSFCPGKAMRVMAADVARWHKASGGDVHPDTKVWAALPLPWTVLDGTAWCTRSMVNEVCDKNGVPREGWTAPRGARTSVAFAPTPELVHGVQVTSPALALALRKAGVFSGKVLKGPLPEFEVMRDAHGAALGATPAVAQDESARLLDREDEE